jgi:CheY-like chemotaxis protein
MQSEVERDGSAADGDLFIVDDTPANLGLLARLLRDAGHSVRVANSGRRALAAIAAAPPELVLLDINMPDLSGLEVCTALKSDPATSEIPVLFLSALAGVREKLQAFGVGGLDYVTKPFQAEEVLARVETQLRLSRLRRALADKNRELERANEELLQARSHAQQIFAALTDVLEGTVLDGSYRLENKIGTGGTAAVYRATVLETGAPVAVKVLRPQPGSAGQAGRAFSERRTLARLAHTNAVTVIDSGVTPSGIAYLVMELLSGRSLGDELAELGRLAQARCAQILLPVARVLAEAHAAGVVHRDVKPANIFLHQSEQGELVKVVDFGIARADEDLAEPGRTSGWFTGTPIYMAPERLLGQPYDGRADVYGLGVTLYQALSGTLPFQSSGTLGALIMNCIHTAPVPLRDARPDASAELEALVMRALAKRPIDRPTMSELAELLATALTDAESLVGAAGRSPESDIPTVEIER